DEVFHGVEDFHPVLVGLGDAREQAAIIQRYRSLADHRMQQWLVSRAAVGQTKNAQQIAIGAAQPSQGELLPSQLRRQAGTQEFIRRDAEDIGNLLHALRQLSI